jgi:hypothetical protein
MPPTLLVSTNNRFIRIQQSELEALKQEKSLIEANALPTFQLGASNMSIRGWETIQNQDVYHRPSDRFSSLNFIIQWPKSRQATKNELVLNQLLTEQQTLQLSVQQSELERDYQDALNNWRAAWDVLKNQRDLTLNNAAIITHESNILLENGAITIIEWAAMMRQALQSQLNLLDLTAHYNETAITLKTILNNE